MTHSLLNTLNRQQLADLYNAHAEKKLGLASTKPIAVSRVEALCKELDLEVYEYQSADGKGVVALRKPAPAPEAAPKAAAKPVHGLAARRGPKPAYDDTHIITVLAKSNPKRKDSESYRRFALYRNGMTVAEYLNAAHKLQPGVAMGRWRADLSFDTERDYIKVEPKAGR